jgi:predicted 3-demethylubiquinone-9 3-methyltransferase (glyoxalase superfamily)
MSKVATCLWFDGKAQEAAEFYVSLLPDSRIDAIVNYGVDGPGGSVGDVMAVEFTLAGQRYAGLNGGPYFELSPAVSISVACADQAEVDRLWGALLAGGEPQQCGWIADRYGLSWQIVPSVLLGMLKNGDPQKVRRVTEAIMQMIKPDIAALEDAYAG